MSTETLADILDALEKSSLPTPVVEQAAPEPEPAPEVGKSTPQKTKATKPSTEVAVESGIPIPSVAQPNSRVYPLDDMEVGDSFFMASDNKRALTNRIRSAISQYSRRKANNRKYITRCVDGGVRCWRTV